MEGKRCGSSAEFTTKAAADGSDKRIETYKTAGAWATNETAANSKNAQDSKKAANEWAPHKHANENTVVALDKDGTREPLAIEISSCSREINDCLNLARGIIEPIDKVVRLISLLMAESATYDDKLDLNHALYM
jgi:hypothetical protein